LFNIELIGFAFQIMLGCAVQLCCGSGTPTAVGWVKGARIIYGL
jgi:hypothetical protein